MSLEASNYQCAASPFVPGDPSRGPAGVFNSILTKKHTGFYLLNLFNCVCCIFLAGVCFTSAAVDMDTPQSFRASEQSALEHNVR